MTPEQQVWLLITFLTALTAWLVVANARGRR